MSPKNKNASKNVNIKTQEDINEFGRSILIKINKTSEKSTENNKPKE